MTINLTKAVSNIRASLDRAVAQRAKEGHPDCPMWVTAICQPGEEPICNVSLCKMEDLIAILDAVRPVDLVRDDQ